MGKNELMWFLDFLNIPKNELIKDKRMDLRIKIQKSVYLLNYLGNSPFNNYNFSMYVRGPYCKDLADDYYSLEGITPSKIDINEKLVWWYSNNNTEWLEVSSTILSITKRNPDCKSDEIYEILKISKSWVSKDLFDKITKQLKENNILR